MSSNFIVRDFNFKEHAKIGYSDGETVLTFRTEWPRKQTGAQTVKLSEADDALDLLKFLCELGLPKINKSAREDSAVRCLMKTIGVLEDGTVFFRLGNGRATTVKSFEDFKTFVEDFENLVKTARKLE